jgi:dipeptidyl-peptidase-3
MLDRTEKEIFTDEKPYYQIGFPDNEGSSSYYSSNISHADAKLIDDFCLSINLSPLNTRLFKLSETEYELRIASLHHDEKVTPYLKEYDYEGKKITVSAGDFQAFMQKIVHHMEEAKKHVSNDNQGGMVQSYVDHFKHGDVDKHKDSQRYWIKDVGPIVETNIGYIETYLDPLGARAEFEGFVSIVDK